MANRRVRSRRAVALVLLCGQFVAGVTEAQAVCLSREPSAEPWASATRRDGDGRPLTRFVPPELYSGAAWSGDRALVLRPMNVTRKPEQPHDHPAITISGPEAMAGDPTVPVLRRERVSRRKGSVIQHFRINERQDGLGRVSDERPGRSRAMDECFKFPLGEWRKGEERRCRGSVIRIIELDFEYGCVAHALKFRWNDEGTYVFAPGRGLVAVDSADE